MSPNLQRVGMTIVFKKLNKSNHELRILRSDNTGEAAVLHTETYFLHDICHYVVETELRLTDGFWGMLAQGHEMAELSGKTNELTGQLRLIEHVVGGAQSVCRGHMTEAQFWQSMAIIDFPTVDDSFLQSVVSKIEALMRLWKYLPISDSIELEFSDPQRH